MSLYVYLNIDAAKSPEPERRAIFIREGGERREISREEWDQRHPDLEPVSVLVGGDPEDTCVYSANITHNLGAMARAAGIYEQL